MLLERARSQSDGQAGKRASNDRYLTDLAVDMMSSVSDVVGHTHLSKLVRSANRIGAFSFHLLRLPHCHRLSPENY